MTERILLTRDGKVATITLNRPEKRNAFDIEMIDAWAAALRACRDDDDIQVILVTGAGAAFCAGGDIGFMREGGDERSAVWRRKSALWDHIQRIPLALEDIDKPVISVVNGVASGAGMDMALMTDLRFAGEGARFAESYVLMATVPGAGGAYFLPRLVGVAKALELFWSGEMIDAREAERIGLVNKVLPDDELMDYAADYARRLAAGPTQAIRLVKRAVYQSLRADLRAALDMASSHFAVIGETDDHREAVEAFFDKRTPRFKGS